MSVQSDTYSCYRDGDGYYMGPRPGAFDKCLLAGWLCLSPSARVPSPAQTFLQVSPLGVPIVC